MTPPPPADRAASQPVPDRALDLGLREVIGGEQPPDLRDAVVDGLRWDSFDGTSDRKDGTLPAPRSSNRWLAAAVVMLGLGAVIAVLATRGEDAAGTNQTNQPAPRADRTAQDPVALEAHDPDPMSRALEVRDLAHFHELVGAIEAIEFIPWKATFANAVHDYIRARPDDHEWERDPATLARWMRDLTASTDRAPHPRRLQDHRCLARLWLNDPGTDEGRYVLVGLTPDTPLAVARYGTVDLPTELATEWGQKAIALARAGRLGRGLVYSGSELLHLDVEIREVTARGLGDADMRDLVPFRKLARLDLSACGDVTQEGIRLLCDALAERRDARNGWGSITDLILPDGIRLGAPSLPRFSDLGPLHRVRCAGAVFAAESVVHAESRVFPGSLRSLDLSAARLTEPWLRALLRGLQIQELVLDGTEGLDPSAVLTIAAQQKLTSLSLRNCSSLTGTDLGPLAALPLTRLDSSGVTLTPTSLRAVCGIASLESLGVVGCGLGEGAVDELLRADSLQELRIGPGPADVGRLTALRHLRRLELHLPHGRTAADLSEILDAFRTQLPRCEVVLRSAW